MVIKNIFELYKIGKELGLSSKEINSVLIFKNRFPLILALMVIIILTVFTVLFWNIALILYTRSTESTYPSGARYSSISIKDFKKKKRIKIKRIR
ncbi:MAG: hypothetical protein ACFFB0_11135 [Promethearchaeota archaeon]